MKEPNIVQKHSFKMELEPGKYFWCACGLSKNQPFCDSSHKITDFKPVKFEILETKRVGLCGCKHTQTPPYCDHTHRAL